MRRSSAALVAAVMSLSAVSCGSIGDSKRNADPVSGSILAQQMEEDDSSRSMVNNASTTRTTQKTTAETEPAADKVTTDTQVTTTTLMTETTAPPAEAENSFAVEYAAGVTYTPTVQELSELSKLVTDQFAAARDDNKQGYLDSMNFGGIIRSQNFSKLLSDVDNYSGTTAQNEVYMQAVVIFVEDYAYKKYKDVLTELEGKEDQSRYLSAISSAVDEFGPDNAGTLFDKEGEGIYAQMISDNNGLPEDFKENKADYTIDDNAFYYCSVSSCDKVGEDVFAVFDLSVFSGEHQYSFGSVKAFSCSGSKGVMVGDVTISDNPYKDMSAAELEGVAKQAAQISRSNSLAKEAYTQASLYMADRLSASGENAAAVFSSGAFSQASSTGIDLAGEEPGAAGDKALYLSFTKRGIRSGKIYVGSTSATATGYFAQYTEAADSGIIGQYPDPATLESYSDYTFGTHSS